MKKILILLLAFCGSATLTNRVLGQTASEIANIVSGATVNKLSIDVTSAAITTTATSAVFTPLYGSAYEIHVSVTATAGTLPNSVIQVQESADGITGWRTVFTFPAITAIGDYYSGVQKLKGTKVRYIETISGTSPSFTRSINRTQTSADGNNFNSVGDLKVAFNSTPEPYAPPFSQLVTNSVQTVKSTTGDVYGWEIVNYNSTPIFVKFFDAATVTLGTTVPSITIPINGISRLNIQANGTPWRNFRTNSIKVAVTLNSGTADTTSPGASGVFVDILYK